MKLFARAWHALYRLPLLAAQWLAYCFRRGWLQAGRDLRFWLGTLARRQSAFDLGLPWFPLDAIRWLGGGLRPGMTAFEWGSGGSTLFLARHGCRLTSIEHDPGWQARVAGRLAAQGAVQVECRLVTIDNPGTAGEPGSQAYRSALPEYRGASFKRYVHAIDSLPDACLDLLIVDGRARAACALAGRGKLRPGGWLVLDDAGRGRYRAAQAQLLAEGWRRQVFYGPCPGALWPAFHHTAVFTRPGEGG